jgi:excisionase family DNA binding protein
MAARKQSSSANKNGELLDVAGAADLLDVSTRTIYRLVKEQKIPHARVGRKLRFHKSSLVQWIATGGENADAFLGDSIAELLNSGKARVR